MMRFRVGVAGSPSAGKAMANYMEAEPLKIANEELARYYAGETIPEPTDLVEKYGQAIAFGEVGFGEALHELLQFHAENDQHFDRIKYEVADDSGKSAHTKYDEMADRLSGPLSEAALKAEVQQDIADRGGTLARIRPNIPPEIADKLAIPLNRPLHTSEVANLFNGLQANGQPIAGKQVQSPMHALTEVFGLSGRALPTPEMVANVAAGLRMDGAEPVQPNGEPYAASTIKGATKRFLSIYGLKEPPTPEQLDLMKEGRTAQGGYVDRSDYLRAVNATKSPVAYVEMVWSPDKTLSVAWALASTEAERGILREIHQQAVNNAMEYAEEILAVARRGDESNRTLERGKLAWIMFDHYTARPTAEIAQVDAEGRPYTVMQDVPMNVPDMHLHTHTMVPNGIFCPSGHVGAIALDLLDGKVKELGGVYQAFVAKGCREHGIDVQLNERTGAAQVMSVPEQVRRHFSKRSRDAKEAAREFAGQQGLVWDDLSDNAKLKLLERGKIDTKNRKYDRDKSDFVAWQEQAEKDLGYRHGTILHTVPVRDEYDQNERRRTAYDRVMHMVSDMFTRRSKIGGQELREVATRGLIEGGMDNPADDINAVTKAFRERGVMNEGGMTEILWGRDAPVRGRERWSVTTGFHERTEREMLDLARRALADRSRAVPRTVLDRHIAQFLEDNPKVDTKSKHWQAQRNAAYRIGMGGSLDGAIGAAGAGKTTILSPLVAAWQEQGRDVYGIALAHTHASALRGAGIDQKKRTAIASFMKRVEIGRYKLNDRAVVVIDEFGLIAKRDFLNLLRLQKQHGFEIKFVGDVRQCQAVEAAPVMQMMVKAFGEQAFPEIATTVRQAVEREREIAGLFREGKAKEALAMKRADNTARLVVGGREPTIAATATLWRQTLEENAHRPDFTLSVTAPTNTDVLAIGSEIRKEHRAMGKLGDDHIICRVSDDADGAPVEIALAVGEKVRLFDRIHLAGGHVLANNADIVEIMRFTDVGFIARNDEDVEGLVQWEKIRADIKRGEDRPVAPKAWHGGELPIPYDGPVRLTYGYARTIDSSMGITATQNIDCWPDGTRAGQAYSSYVSNSRHVEKSTTIINEAAERKQIFASIPLGAFREVREEEVWSNIERNLSRQPTKGSALDFVEACRDLHRGTVLNFQKVMEPLERSAKEGRLMNWFGLSRERDAMERGVAELQRELAGREAVCEGHELANERA